MTPKQEKQYLEDKGCICPYCGSNDLKCNRAEFVADISLQDVKCLRCNNEWRDVYQLVGAINMEEAWR